MPTSISINLIDKIFTTVATKNVLLTRRYDKINYHKRETISNDERFGTELMCSVNKIVEFDEESKKMKVLLNTTENAPKELVIQNAIEIATQRTSNSNEVV